MDIVAILLLVVVAVLYVDTVNNLKEMEEVINEVISKHNSTVNMVNTLNNRIRDIAKERDETNTKGREQKE